MEQHDPSLIGALCLDHIALPPQSGHPIIPTHIDFASDDPSTDEDMDVSFLRPYVSSLFCIAGSCIGFALWLHRVCS